jgi:enoyl-CoA hydratase/carnithine racemase
VVQITRVGDLYSAIEHALEHNNPQDVVDYLQELQNFCAFIVGYNKPCILEFEGEAYNSAAASFLQMAHVNYHPGASAVFNEAKRGCTLLGGSSYVLSRMPTGIGKFLALTGTPVTGSDLFHFKLATTQLNLDVETLQFIENESVKYPRFRELTVLTLLPPIKSMLMIQDDKIMFRQPERLAKELSIKLQARENPATALLDIVTRELLTNKANSLELTTVANNWEKRLEDLRNLDMLHTIENRMGFFDEYVLDLVRKTQDEQAASIANEKGSLNEQQGLIKSVFNTDNFESIVNNLKKSKTAWAKKTLEKLENIDPKVANHILKQIDFAAHNDYVSCLVNEYQTALRYFSEVSNVKFSPKHAEFVPKSPVRALLPVREYYRDFPDAVRMTLNSSHNNCPFIAKNFGTTANIFLNLHGIDIINPVTNLSVAREVLWRRKSIQREIELEKEQRDDILDNHQLRSNLLADRREAIEAVTTEQNFGEIVQEAIAEAFNKKLVVTKETLAHKFKNVQLLSRKDKLARLRKAVIESKLAPLSSDVGKRKSLAVMPMEVVEDPLLIDNEINDKYFISQRADLLSASFNADSVKIDEYMKGKITLQDMVNVKAKSPGQKALISTDYFRDYVYHPNQGYFQKYRKLFLMNLHRGNGEDPREVAFRERYIESHVQHMLRHLDIPEAMKAEKGAEIEQKLRDLLFDYLDGKDSIYEYKDPHLSLKEEVMNVQDSIDMHELTREKREEVKLDQSIAQQITDLTDLDLKVATKTGSLNLKGGSDTDIEDYVQLNIKENPFLDDRLSFVFQDQPTNPVISKLLNEARDLLIRTFKKHLTKYTSNKSIIATYPELEGFVDAEGTHMFMNHIDLFLKRNIKVDFFDMVASDSISEFSEKMLSRLDDLFEKAFTDIIRPTLPESVSQRPIQDFTGHKDSNFRGALAKIGHINEVTDEVLEDSVRFLDKWLFNLAELQHDFKSPSFKQSEVLPADDMSEEKMTSLLAKKYSMTSYIKPLSTRKSKLSKIVARLVEDQAAKPRLLMSNSLKQREIKEKMVACAQIDPSVENYVDVLRTYQTLKATYMEDIRGLVHSPSALILELETVIKRMREGTESGVYDDFSSLQKILQDSYTNVKESPEDWITHRVDQADLVDRVL